MAAGHFGDIGSGPFRHGLSALPDPDVQALANYFADVDKANDRLASIGPAIARAMSYASLGAGKDDADARLYTTACASCHYNSGQPLVMRPDLSLNSALNLPDPTNLIQVILNGINAKDGIPGVVMPRPQEAIARGVFEQGIHEAFRNVLRYRD